jgi:L-amino acid N-acyltransferase YncA
MAHLIRTATPADIPELTAIYNDVIATSTAIFNDKPVSVEDRLAWFETRAKQGFPVLVAVDSGGQVAGFSTFGDFRAWPGYRFTVEHSVHIHNDWRGKGLGSELMTGLFPIASSMGKHVMVAGVDASNTASLAFHQRLGFEPIGTFREVGHKFGRWLDLTFLQRFLDAPGAGRQ